MATASIFVQPVLNDEASIKNLCDLFDDFANNPRKYEINVRPESISDELKEALRKQLGKNKPKRGTKT